MDDKVYERLADALDALPSGFPRMPSGVELRILKKAFKPEEAALTGHMSRAYEPVGAIAGRAGVPEDKAKKILDDLIPTLLVKKQETDGGDKFRLGPFVIGWYEAYREQAKELFGKLEEQGHVHLGFYGFAATAEAPQFVGCCNCCGDCCGILRGTNDLGLDEGPQKSNFRAAIDLEECVACGKCIDRCQVNAINENEEGMPVLDLGRCIGCGVCVIGCSSEAIEMVAVSAEEWFDIPSSFEEWEERRLQNLKANK